MMLYPPVQELLENIENRYLLVNVVARRARQISLEAEGRGELMEEKPISIAVMEVADGKLTAKVKEEA